MKGGREMVACGWLMKHEEWKEPRAGYWRMDEAE